ncbi:DNA-binding transcriptional MerR regulator [Pantoea sp. AN62]|uniref:MerR family transcriptional regulator n=1 Tax=Pantoea TaxID=53335 RepID=UPI000A248950|nr:MULTISPECIES: MerR family transcriptional regulator [Pantoea]MDU4747238.1 MerR family transcriptional regulator [Pantoea sp.]ORM53892.1 MerR family transcriptional regulator [Pantoea brenneri]OXM20841.1 MerR family transcriptional regulator [Pantoea sp. AV62]HAI07324.1 MerR family transcriptional regulator [Pantoea sp.]
MPQHSTDTVCGLVGVLPETLRRWRRAGLMTPPGPAGYSDSQLTRALCVRDMTSDGHTLFDIHASLRWPALKLQGGWACRKEELLQLLRYEADDDITRELRTMGANYSGDDYVNRYLRPLNLWLRSDASEGAAARQQRFHSAIVTQWQHLALAAQRRSTVPLFLEAVSVTDETEIWMEAIRLNGQGFRVEVAAIASGEPAVAHHRFEHHLMWCSDGITPLMNAAYQSMLEAGKPVMLTGTDTRLKAEAETTLLAASA